MIHPCVSLLCVAQGSLETDTLLRFVTLGDSKSPVKRYTSVLRPFGLLKAPVMRYTLVFRAPLGGPMSSITRTLVLCAPLGGMRSLSGAIHSVYRPLLGGLMFPVRCDTQCVPAPLGRTDVPCPVRYTLCTGPSWAD